MIRMLHRMGIRSGMMYTAGLLSIGASMVSWFISNRYEHAGMDRADRWGLFVGEWVPTFFALGVALRIEEMASEQLGEAPELREQEAEVRQPARAHI